MVLLYVGMLCGIVSGLALLWFFTVDMLKESRRIRRWAEFERALHREHINGLVRKAVDNDDPLIRQELDEALFHYRELV